MRSFQVYLVSCLVRPHCRFCANYVLTGGATRRAFQVYLVSTYERGDFHPGLLVYDVELAGVDNRAAVVLNNRAWTASE